MFSNNAGPTMFLCWTCLGLQVQVFTGLANGLLCIKSE